MHNLTESEASGGLHLDARHGADSGASAARVRHRRVAGALRPRQENRGGAGRIDKTLDIFGIVQTA